MDKQEQIRLGKKLIAAVWRGNISQVRKLLAAGADMNTRDNRESFAAIHLAALYKYTEYMRALIKAGADINAQDKDGWTPLHVAAINGHIGCMRILIEAGADVNIENSEGKTAGDILKQKYPRLYIEHADRLMTFRPEARRLKTEDAAGKASAAVVNGDPTGAGFEFDI